MKSLEDMGKFKTVVVDPPWEMSFSPILRPKNHAARVRLGNIDIKKRELPYESMSVDDIKSLPIQEVLEDNALVFCWVTSRLLPHVFDVLSAWGLRYDFMMTWVKNQGMQPAFRPMFNAEWIAVAKQGSPKYVETRAFATANLWKNPWVHSQKPSEFYELLCRVTEGPRLDVFGRRAIPGFHSWGNEPPEGEPLPDQYQMILV